MRVTAIVMVVASGILIAAHFFRSGAYALAAIGLLFPALLMVRKTFALRVVQLILALAAAEWLRTLAFIVMERHAVGQPWGRLALILGAVAALTGASAVLLGRSWRITQSREAREPSIT